MQLCMCVSISPKVNTVVKTTDILFHAMQIVSKTTDLNGDVALGHFSHVEANCWYHVLIELTTLWMRSCVHVTSEGKHQTQTLLDSPTI